MIENYGDNLNKQSGNDGRVQNNLVDMADRNTFAGLFQPKEAQNQDAISNGFLTFSNPFGSGEPHEHHFDGFRDHRDEDTGGRGRGDFTSQGGADSNMSSNQPALAQLEMVMFTEMQQIEVLGTEIAMDFALLNKGAAGADSGTGSGTASGSSPSDAAGGSSSGTSGATGSLDATPPPASQPSAPSDSAVSPTSSTSSPSEITAPSTGSTSSGEGSGSEKTSGSPPSSTAGDTAVSSPPAATTAPDGGQTKSTNGFDALPSWANDTAINNNNGGLVSPSYFARAIPDNATYAQANLGNLKFIDNGYQYDPGEMIDERGMSPSQLETIPVYAADQAWGSNDSTGQKLGTIEVPKGISVPRPITTYSNGSEGAVNSTTTFIQPDGEEMNFAKTYIGTNSQVGDGGTVLIGAPVGQTGWFGNEVALTNSDVTDVINDGTAPSHALGVVVPTTVLSNIDTGVAGPSKYADSGYKTEYSSSNTNLRMGSLLAIPKNETAQELGLQTPMGDALLATMQQYGAYIADTTPTVNSFEIESTIGVQNQIEQTGESSEFSSDLDKLMAAAQVVTSNPNASPHAQ